MTTTKPAAASKAAKASKPAKAKAKAAPKETKETMAEFMDTLATKNEKRSYDEVQKLLASASQKLGVKEVTVGGYRSHIAFRQRGKGLKGVDVDAVAPKKAAEGS